MLNGMNNLHFIGIGGVGMSAVAYVACKLGARVSGSDEKGGRLTENLARAGVKIYHGHARGQIGQCDAVVLSSAINQDNPEVLEAKERGIPVLHRSDVLADLLNSRFGIAIAGAHGKTTTTSMLSCLAVAAGLDPTILIGGEVAALGGNARYGLSDYLIAEADESDGSFLKLFPRLAILTNIENDHMDFYQTMERIYDAFTQFASQLTAGGALVVCFDDKALREVARRVNSKVISYAINEKADYQAVNIQYNNNGTAYDLLYQGQLLGKIRLAIPGRHNVLNSLAVVAAGQFLNIEFPVIADALAAFAGAKRRFEIKGDIRGALVVDDYAHHPTEIQTTLAAARQTQPKRLICVFQPHRYSRTQLLLEDFGKCFSICDILILTDIYAASEQPIAGVDGRSLLAEVEKQTGQKAVYAATIKDVAEYLAGVARKDDLILTMGAGDIYKAGEMLLGMD